MATQMEITKAYSQSKFAADNALTSADVLQKYKIAADVVNVVLPELVSRVTADTSVCDLCQFGDDLINAQVAHLDSSKEKGIAVPTCVSVNNLVQYFSPLYDSDYVLQAGDVVKIELGAHFDGYIATAAHTTVVPLAPGEPLQGRAADVICATYFAHEAAQRMLRPGVKSSEITRVITEIAAYFRCKPVEGTFSSPMKRFVLRAGKDIENQFPEGLTVQELEKCDFEIAANQVYQMNIVLTTGDGTVKVSEHKPHVYQRDVNKSYQLKMKSARVAYNEINEKFTVFPFATRALSTNQARLGLASVLSHNLITSYIPTRSSKASDFVAQYKSTVLVSADGVLRTTAPLNPPFVHSQYCIPAETMAANILSAPSNITINQTTEPLRAGDVSFGSRRLLNEDTEMDADMA